MTGRAVESSWVRHHMNVKRTFMGPVMTTSGEKQPSKTAIRTLSAINQYRYQRRSGRVWLVGDNRISASTVTNLEREAYVREVTSNGVPRLVLTDQGKRVVGGGAE